MRRIGEVKVAHQVVRLVRDRREATLVEIGGKGVVAGARKPVGDAADLVVETPPFLDHDDARPALPGGREIALGLAAVGAGKLDHRAHAVSPLLGVARQDAAAFPSMQSVAPPRGLETIWSQDRSTYE